MDSETLPPQITSLGIVIVGDREIKKLNRSYRGKNIATDVLSFPLAEGRKKIISPHLGDIVISSETTLRQAEEFGVTAKREFLFLITHGILHLFGYDHEKSLREKKRMEAREDEILRLLGIFDVSR